MIDTYSYKGNAPLSLTKMKDFLEENVSYPHINYDDFVDIWGYRSAIFKYARGINDVVHAGDLAVHSDMIKLMVKPEYHNLSEASASVMLNCTTHKLKKMFWEIIDNNLLEQERIVGFCLFIYSVNREVVKDMKPILDKSGIKYRIDMKSKNPFVLTPQC